MSVAEPEAETASRSAWEAWGAGCSTIPIKDDGSKKPPLLWDAYKSRRPTEAEMTKWFGPYQAAAIICGKVSGGLIMLEMEGPDFVGGAWQRFRAAVVAELGEDRWREITACIEMSPSGGPHLLIRCTETIVGNLKLARRKVGETEVETIMETRGEGGYTVIAGSIGHETGKRWSMAQGSYAAIATVTATELHAILDAARTLDEMPAPPIRLNATTPERPRLSSADSIFDAVVDDYNRHTTWDDVLRGVFEYAYQKGQVTYWHRVGSDNETGATTNGTGRDTLIVFSSSTVFESFDGTGPAPSYDRFGAYAVLEHGGDRTDAYRTLRDHGYGPPTAPVGKPTPPPISQQLPPLVDGETGEMIEVDPDERKPTSWLPIDLRDALSGVDVPAPRFWMRSDGKPLVYAGRTHWFQGPSESLKSMAAQMVAVEVVADGGDVLYIDFEDDDRGVVARLLAMGATEQEIAAHVVYVRPDEALMDRGGKWTPGGLDYLATLAMRPWAVCVLDGVTEAMTTEGMEILDNADTARWMRLLPKRIADTGAAVVVIDHTTKNAETAGRHAIGAQHKLAGVTGATYKFEPVRPLARAESEEITGQVKITITKDRPGWVRGQCKDGVVGMFEVTSYPDGGLSPQMMAPGAESSVVDMELIGEILTYLHTYDGASQRRIEEAVDARSARVRGALQAAHGRGWIIVKKVGAGHQHSLTDDGRKVMK